MNARRLRPTPALLFASLLLLAAPFAEQAVPTDIVRVEDPEPLPDIAKDRVTPHTLPDQATPAVRLPPAKPDSHLTQPAPAIQPERVTPPTKGPTGGTK